TSLPASATATAIVSAWTSNPTKRNLDMSDLSFRMRLGRHRIIRHHDSPQISRRSLKRSLAFHRDDAVRDHEMRNLIEHRLGFWPVYCCVLSTMPVFNWKGR